MTNRQICSDIIDFLRANNIDERFSYRFVLSELRNATQNFIKQDSDNRRLFKNNELWKSIPCGMKLLEVPLIECGFDIVDRRTIMKSEVEFPKSYATNYGHLLRISNLDGSLNLIETTFEDLFDKLNRKYIPDINNYFFIQNNFLYVPNSSVEAINVTGIFKDDDYKTKGQCKSPSSCVKPLNEEFNCPDYLVKIVKDSVKQALLSSLQRQVDNKPDLDSLSKI